MAVWRRDYIGKLSGMVLGSLLPELLLCFGWFVAFAFGAFLYVN